MAESTPMKTTTAVDGERFCLFQCEGNVFAVDALTVRCVTPAAQATRLPLSHPSLSGLAVIHKEIVPVFSLGDLVRAPSSTSAAPLGQTLVMESLHGPWAIEIEQALGLHSLEISFDSVGEDTSTASNFIKGSAAYQDEFVSVIDSEALYEQFHHHVTEGWLGREILSSVDETPTPSST